MGRHRGGRGEWRRWEASQKAAEEVAPQAAEEEVAQNGEVAREVVEVPLELCPATPCVSPGTRPPEADSFEGWGGGY